MLLLYESVMNGKKEEDILSIHFIINESTDNRQFAINSLLIKCKVKNFMDINRQISAEKYVYVCVESLEFIFWNVHKEASLYLLLNNARIIFQNLCR